MLTGAVPFDDVPHAGGRYLGSLLRHLARTSSVTVVAAATPASRDAATRCRGPGGPRPRRRGGGPHPALPGDRPARRVGERWWRRVDPGLPPLALVADLLTGGPAARAVREADVVDLQWSEQVRLAGLVRRLAPHARVVGTFHDVQSQLFAREPSVSWWGRLAWQVRSRRARAHERRSLRRLDAAVVFSAKDARLLGSPGRAHVVPPPLAPAEATRHPAPAGTPTVLLVGYLARPENDDGARWLLREVWPDVAHRVPGARLRIVGAGAGQALRGAVDAAERVALAGYVPDLDAEYASAWCCVVPVRSGAGVKFKTVEALVHGVPVVSTPVGAEGIGEASWFAAVTDDPCEVADALVAVLDDPEPAFARAAEVQDDAVAVHGPVGFETAVGAVYGPTDPAGEAPLR